MNKFAGIGSIAGTILRSAPLAFLSLPIALQGLTALQRKGYGVSFANERKLNKAIDHHTAKGQYRDKTPASKAIQTNELYSMKYNGGKPEIQ